MADYSRFAGRNALKGLDLKGIAPRQHQPTTVRFSLGQAILARWAAHNYPTSADPNKEAAADYSY